MGFISAAIGIIGLIGANKAAKDAKRAAKAEAAIDQRVTQEKVRNLDIQERVMRGQTIAAAAGSGVKANVGSPLTILAEQAKTFAREKAFTQEVGAERSRLGIQRGRMVGQQARFQGYAQAAGAFGNAATSFKKFGFGFG